MPGSFGIGDLVEVTDDGMVYPTMARNQSNCIEWPSEDIRRQAHQYAWSGWSPRRGDQGHVIWIGTHCHDDVPVYVIQFRANGTDYYAPFSGVGLKVITTAPARAISQVTLETLKAIPQLRSVDDSLLSYVVWLTNPEPPLGSRLNQIRRRDAAIQALGLTSMVGRHSSSPELISDDWALEVSPHDNSILLVDLSSRQPSTRTPYISRYQVSAVVRGDRPILLGEIDMPVDVTPFANPDQFLDTIRFHDWLEHTRASINQDAPTEWAVVNRDGQSILNIDLIEKNSRTEYVNAHRTYRPDLSFVTDIICHVDLRGPLFQERIWSTDLAYFREKAPLTVELLYAMFNTRYPNRFTLSISPMADISPIEYTVVLQQDPRPGGVIRDYVSGRVSMHAPLIHGLYNAVIERPLGDTTGVQAFLREVSQTINELNDRRRGVI